MRSEARRRPFRLNRWWARRFATLRLQNSYQIGQPLKVDLSEFVASALQGKFE